MFSKCLSPPKKGRETWARPLHKDYLPGETNVISNNYDLSAITTNSKEGFEKIVRTNLIKLIQLSRELIYKYDAVVDGQSHENTDQIVLAKVCRIALIRSDGEPVTPEKKLFYRVLVIKTTCKHWQKMLTPLF